MQGGCRTERVPREGNKISGEVECAADRTIAAGTTRFVYRGEVMPDRILPEANLVLDGKLRKGAGGPEVSDAALENAMRSVEDIKTVIASRRVSDCP